MTQLNKNQQEETTDSRPRFEQNHNLFLPVLLSAPVTGEGIRATSSLSQKQSSPSQDRVQKVIDVIDEVLLLLEDDNDDFGMLMDSFENNQGQRQ